MNVAVFSDKFSGTLTAKEALDTIKDVFQASDINAEFFSVCLLYTSPSPRDQRGSRMPSSA